MQVVRTPSPRSPFAPSCYSPLVRRLLSLILSPQPSDRFLRSRSQTDRLAPGPRLARARLSFPRATVGTPGPAASRACRSRGARAEVNVLFKCPCSITFLFSFVSCPSECRYASPLLNSWLVRYASYVVVFHCHAAALHCTSHPPILHPASCMPIYPPYTTALT
jgi:hypothetical protein